MNLIKIIIIVIMLWDNNSASRHTFSKLIYQKDVSEHCRRRVLPSIFLGRQVVNANSQILQFSRLELPYSCFISIRTESGSNMIMMIQLATEDLKKSCSKNNEQLVVLEIGETFGGYWGPLPDSIMSQTPYNQSNFYTIKTTHTTTASSTETSDEPEENVQKLLAHHTKSIANETAELDSEDYAVVAEIPIVNVSMRLEPGPKRPEKTFDSDVVFDVENDVTPIPGVSYDTKLLPLVQFSLKEDMIARRLGEDDSPKYELDFIGDFTPDMRLTLPPFSATKRSFRRYHATRRLKFKKHKNLIDAGKYDNRKIVSRKLTKYEFPTKITHGQITSTKLNESWHIIEDIIKNLDGNAVHAITPTSEEDVLEKIAKLDHNRSAYLLPQWPHKNDWKTTKMKSTTVYDDELKNPDPKKMLTIRNTSHTTVTSKSVFKSSEGSKYISNTTYSNITEDNNNSQRQPDEMITLLPNFSKYSEEIEKRIEKGDSESLAANNKETKLIVKSSGITNSAYNVSMIKGSMVGHESWENVVQAAPEMAIKLNRSVAYDTDSPQLNETRHDDSLLRKKREIHSINIENARPHDMTVLVEKTTTTASQFQIADMQEFAQLVELQDNEFHGRVALRYLRQYVGPALFNLCDFTDTAPRHVHLFNSSRIVMAISNFTLDRMIITLTSARTLLSGELSCPASHLECQVSGARVCLDSTVACDGVPNCGSYDIYDEDRLLCGAGKGSQHNVYLAAFTFLAALLTIMYVLHYWLKRCVPKVVDAFFIYTNGFDNALYLDTIMRSPNDPDDNLSKMVYHSTAFGDYNIYDELEIGTKPNICKRFLNKCCSCCKSIKKKDNLSDEREDSFTNLQKKRLYSFTYSDINEMFSSTRDTAIQTGESLEMQFLQEMNKLSKKENNVKRSVEMIQTPSPPLLIQDSILTLEELLPKEEDELSLVKFFRDARNHGLTSDSAAYSGNAKLTGKVEIELTTLDYDNASKDEPGTSGVTTSSTKKATGSHKHLRFDEVMTMIPIKDDEIEEEQDSIDTHRSVQLLENKGRRAAQHLDTIDEDEEQTTTLKDTFHFWGSSKQKKSKKKPQNPR